MREGELFEQSAVHIFGEGEGQVQQLQCGHDKASSLPSVKLSLHERFRYKIHNKNNAKIAKNPGKDH